MDALWIHSPNPNGVLSSLALSGHPVTAFSAVSGVYFPALTSLLSQRVQESERAFTYSTVGAGSQFG